MMEKGMSIQKAHLQVKFRVNRVEGRHGFTWRG